MRSESIEITYKTDACTEDVDAGNTALLLVLQAVAIPGLQMLHEAEEARLVIVQLGRLQQPPLLFAIRFR